MASGVRKESGVGVLGEEAWAGLSLYNFLGASRPFLGTVLSM